MQPIYIDVSDEITTVIERMKASSAKSLALVIPKGAILLQSIVNLKLAKKAAADAGKDLTLVTTDKIGRNLASQVGLTVLSRLDAKGEEDINPNEEPDTGSEPHIIDGVKVHRYYENSAAEKAVDEDEATAVEPIIPREIMQPKEDAAQAENEAPIVVREIKTDTPKEKVITKTAPIVVPESAAALESGKAEVPSEKPIDTEKKTDKPKKNYRKLLIFGSYIVILLLLGTGGVAAFYLPQTTVTIGAKSQPWNKELVETAKVGASTSSDGSTVPAELITAEVEDKEGFKSTGSKDVGEKASGTAQIFNGYSSTPQDLPSGTTVTANGLNFITQEKVSVPGAQVQNGKPVPGAATVKVVAEKAGSDSNLSGVTGTIPQSNLYGQIVSTSGGTSKQVAVVTATDIANAKIALTKKIREKADAKVVEQLHDRSVLFDDKTDSFTLENFLTTQLSGTETDSAEVSAKGTLKRLVIDTDTLKAATVQRVQDSQSKDNTYLLDSFETSKLAVNMADQSATVTTMSVGRFSPTIATDSLRSQLVGKNKESGLALINLVVKDASVTIEQKPSWWPNKNFPYSSRYLTVKVTYE